MYSIQVYTCMNTLNWIKQEVQFLYMLFLFWGCHMTGEIFIFKINISYKNINSYGNIIIIFLLHFLYNFQYILRNQISFKNNRYISHRKWTKIIKYPIGILFFRRILKSYRSFVQIHLEFILLYEVPKYPIMCPMWIMTPLGNCFPNRWDS